MKILGYEIKVERASLDDKYGEYDGDKRTIRIDHTTEDANLKATILHEMLHAILSLTGHSYWLGEKKEEALVRALEHALLPFIDKKQIIKGVKSEK